MFGIPEWAIGVGTIILVASAASAALRLLIPGYRSRSFRYGGGAPEMPEGVQARLDELDEVKRRVSELEERVDFAERLLAQQREGQRLPPPS